MSQYFSRLAQRSGVGVGVAPSARAASAGAADAWSDSAAETVALGAPSEATDWTPGPEDFARPATLSVPLAAATAPAIPEAPVPVAPGASPPVERTFAAAPSDGPGFLAHVRAMSGQWRDAEIQEGQQATDGPVRAAALPSPDASGKSSAGQAPAGADTPASPTRVASTPDPVRAVARPAAATAEAAASPAGDHAQTQLPIIATRRTRAMPRHVDAQPPSSNGTPSRRIDAQPLRSDRTPAAPPPLQVHIGRIELEVHAPAAMPIQPAPAAPPVPQASAAPRAAAFNPHRHYLRGR